MPGSQEWKSLFYGQVFYEPRYLSRYIDDFLLSSLILFLNRGWGKARQFVWGILAAQARVLVQFDSSCSC